MNRFARRTRESKPVQEPITWPVAIKPSYGYKSARGPHRKEKAHNFSKVSFSKQTNIYLLNRVRISEESTYLKHGERPQSRATARGLGKSCVTDGLAGIMGT